MFPRLFFDGNVVLMIKVQKAHHGGSGIYGVIGKDFAHLEKDSEVANADGLDAWFDPSPKASQKLSENLDFAVRTSPPLHADGLKETISEYRGVPVENILVAGGSSDLMYVLFPNLSFKKALILDPMYGEYRHIFEKVLDGVELITHNLLAENNFDIEVNDFINTICQTKPDLVTIVNPNSPAGKALRRKDIEHILSNIPEEILFIIDETYIDYVGSAESVETLVPQHSNLIVIKSMSKVYGLSGARVAYMVVPQSFVQKLDAHIPPFSVSTPAQILAIESLKDVEYYKERWNKTKELRENMANALQSLPSIKVYAGEGNFVLIQLLGDNAGKAEDIIQKLTDRNIFIRNADSMSKQFHGDFLRIAIKDRDTNTRIFKGLEEVL